MSNSDLDEPQPEQFWRAFDLESHKLFDLVFSSNVLAAYQRIGELLSGANYPYVYEVTSDENNAILVFTPESDADLARIVDAFVRVAPPIPKWRVFNRRQRRPVEDAFAMLEKVYEVDASDAVFSICKATNGFDVTMHTDAAELLGDPEKEGFASFFLEHAIGEELAMRMVRKRDVARLDDNASCLSPGSFVEAMVAAAVA